MPVFHEVSLFPEKTPKTSYCLLVELLEKIVLPSGLSMVRGRGYV